MTNSKKLKVYNWLSAVLPDFGVFKRMRKAVLRWSGVRIPSSVNLCGTVRFVGSGEIVIGENSIVRDGCLFHVSGGGKIVIGRNAKIAENTLLECLADPLNPGALIFGDHVDFMMGSLASANGNSRVLIGNDCKIAHNVSIKATEHEIVDGNGCIAGDCVFRDITICDGCWICAGAIITPGVTIGRRCVVGAGAVVLNNAPDSVLMAGVPAIIKKRYL